MRVLGSQPYTSGENGLLWNLSVFNHLVGGEMETGLWRVKKVECGMMAIRVPWPSGATGQVLETVKMLLSCPFRWKSPWKRWQATGIIYFFWARKIGGNNGTKVVPYYLLACLWCQPCLWHLNRHKITGPILAQRDEFICFKYGNPSTPNLLTARLQYETRCSPPRQHGATAQLPQPSHWPGSMSCRIPVSL